MHWTSENVIPALTPKQVAVPFVDPNISSINIDNSFAASFPASPVPRPRNGKRLNLNRTPERLDEGVAMFGSSSENELTPSDANVKRALAITLMKSCCAIYSDWLSVTDACAFFIAQASTQHWTGIFHAADQVAEMSPVLGPGLLRLAVRLAMIGGEFNLLQRLLRCLDGDTDATETISDAVRGAFAAMFSSRGAQADVVVKKSVGCILDAAYDVIRQEDSELDYELPDTLAELWVGDAGCIRSALMSTLGNKQASQELARQLVEERFPEHARDQSTAGLALFDLNCMWLLCDIDSKLVLEMLTQSEVEYGLQGNQELGRVMKQLRDRLSENY